MRDSFIYVAIYLNKNSPLEINLCVFVFPHIFLGLQLVISNFTLLLNHILDSQELKTLFLTNLQNAIHILKG